MINYEENGVCFERLLREYKEHGKLIIAFDFDNTVFDYHGSGLELSRAIRAIKMANRLGHEVFCFTANNDHDFVTQFCDANMGFVPAINKSSLDCLFESRKPFYSLLLDDRAGLGSAVNLLEQLNDTLNRGESNET